MMRPYILAETNWKTVRNSHFQVAVLPWGATEAHNFHLPYGTDTYQVDYVAAKAAQIAWEKGAKVIVLPAVPFGVNTGQLDIPLCLNMLPSTQLAVLKDLADVLVRAGIPKLVILNGHGGNDFKCMIRELSVSFPQLFVCALNWYRAADWRAFFPQPGDHAGQMETSVMMYLMPHLVLPLSEAGEGSERKFIPKAFREGWAIAQRAWSQISCDTGVGNPQGSSAELAKPYLEACIQQIAAFWVELAVLPNDGLYE
ncbi:MAG: creatininase family protein [Cytophagales bacterium]|nr:creatininase family protein [Cytophagales bacterium]